MLIPVFHRSNLVTYLGLLSAVGGIALAVAGRTGYGMLCLAVCGVCDLFDGVFARRFSRSETQKAIGVQLDSLADVLNFTALPLALLAGGGYLHGPWLAAGGLFALASASRLAYYNASVVQTDTARPVDFYTGLPVTYAALVLPLLWLLAYTPAAPALAPALPAALLILSLLYVWNRPVKKPGGVLYGVFALLALGTITAILLLEGGPADAL